MKRNKISIGESEFSTHAKSEKSAREKVKKVSMKRFFDFFARAKKP